MNANPDVDESSILHSRKATHGIEQEANLHRQPLFSSRNNGPRIQILPTSRPLDSWIIFYFGLPQDSRLPAGDYAQPARETEMDGFVHIRKSAEAGRCLLICGFSSRHSSSASFQGCKLIRLLVLCVCGWPAPYTGGRARAPPATFFRVEMRQWPDEIARPNCFPTHARTNIF